MPLAESLLASLLEARGLGPVELAVTRFDFSTLRIEKIRLPFGKAERILVRYDLASLREGLAETALISGLELHVRWENGRLSLAGLGPTPGRAREPLTASGEAAGLVPFLPVKRIVIESATLRVDSPFGPLGLLADGTIALAPQGSLAALLALSAETEFGFIDGRLEATVEPDASATAALRVDDGRLNYRGVSLSGMTGQADLRLRGSSIEALDAELAFSGLAVEDERFEPGALALHMTPERFIAQADLAWPHGRLALKAEGDPREDQPTLEVNADGFVGASVLLQRVEPGASASGEVSFDLSGTLPGALASGALGEVPPASWLELAELRGTIELDLEDVGLEGRGGAASVTGELRLHVGRGAARLEASHDLAVQGPFLDSSVLSRLPAAAREVFTNGAVVAFSTLGERAPYLRVETQGAGYAATLASGFRASSGGGELEGAIDLGLSFDEGFGLKTVETADLTARIVPAAGTSLVWGGELRLTDIAPLEEAYVGAAALYFHGEQGALGGLSFARFDLDLSGGLTLAKGGLALESVAGGLRADGLVIGDRTFLPAPLELRLTGMRNSLELDEAGSGLRYALVFAPSELEIIVRPGDGEELKAHISTGGFSVEGAAERHRLVLRNAGATLAARALSAEGVAGVVEWTPIASSAVLTIGRVSHLAHPPLVRPLSATLEARLQGRKAELTLGIFDPEGGLELRAEGSHDLREQRGSARVVLDPLRFGSGFPPVDEIFPAAGEWVESVSGTFAVAGRLAWDSGELTPDLAFHLEDLSFTARGTRISGLRGEVRINGFAPLATPPGQEIQATIDVDPLGPITLELVFQVQSDRRLMIEGGRAVSAAGRLETGSALIDPSRRSGALELKISSADLAKISALIDIEGLSGTGSLNGVIPITLDAGRLAIEGGKLEAEGAGIVRLSHAALEDTLEAREDVVGLAARALSEFHYESLTLAIDKPFEGEGTVLLHLEGANPAVLEGYPFVFNISFSSDFDKLARVLREGLDTVDRAFRWSLEAGQPRSP